ncbi:hypothetical protein CWRG_02554 [Chthonomonas calidirosea]|uniref:Lumazine-binding n=1 Tax=Chthonomonas calidirosea (strain DSM 23976 / ICMP 18418 / T49) TaxID=1303518 RepID=S0EV98_CHTCT|nr:hypothetical protein [Chthonomonas calidirosea]CCW35339.1 hypothetical protein CCALI_01523 [Chthonomonas calidirosea T49]CEK19590.1 hypothetical protein CWRG_02554 [Chthonomonas calidirosea]CEK19599.1 hypothetical protein CP488_02575 [Chthonomonas calidirosea]CEK20566.1 hypothetical protein CTKA_02577 [Chthonomonas calidirosea]
MDPKRKNVRVEAGLDFLDFDFVQRDGKWKILANGLNVSNGFETFKD